MSCEKRLAVSYDRDRSVVQPLDEDDILWIPSSYLASNNVVISIDDLVGITGGACNFSQLTDTPVDFDNCFNCIVQVNSTATGLCYGNITTLISTTTNLANLKNVNVSNAFNNQVLCYDGTTNSWIASDIDFSQASFLDLNDTESSYNSNSQKVLRVNDSETGIEFVSPASVLGTLALDYLCDVDAQSATLGQFLKFNGLSWVPVTLPPITDEYVKADVNDSTCGYLDSKVDNSTIEVDNSNHVLRVKNGVFAPFCHCHPWSDIIMTNSTINDFSDVNFSNLCDGQILVWDDSSNTFVNCDRVASDELVKVSSSDPVSGYLVDKIDNTTLVVSSTNKICVANGYFSLAGHNHDDRYYTESEIDSMLSNYSCCNHNHDNRYYTQTCLNNGVLDIRYYTESEIDSMLGNYSCCNHNHDNRYYTQDCLNNGVLDNRYYTETEINALLDNKSDCGHTHDDRYYTESEIDSMLSNYSCCNHNHDTRYYTQTCLNNGVLDNRYYTETEINALLDNKSDCGHTHIWTEVSKVGSVLNDIENVSVCSPVCGDVLTFDGSNWVNGSNDILITDEKVKIDANDPNSGYLIDKIDGLTIVVCNSHIAVKDGLYALINHNHDDRYYTESEIDSMLSNYSCCNHNHDDRYYQQCEIDDILSCYSLCTHNHDGRYYTQVCINYLLNQKSSCGHTHTWDEVSKTGSSLTDLDDVTAAPTQGFCNGCVIAWNGSSWELNNVDTLQGSFGQLSLFNGDTLGYLEDKVDPSFFCVDHSNSLLKIIPNVFAAYDHNHDDRYYTEAEIDSMLSCKSDCGHTHDDRYYTEAEIDSMLSCKSDCGHIHDTRYYTQTCLNNGVLDSRYYTESETDTLLANKADCGHMHPWTDINKAGSSLNDLDDVEVTGVAINSLLSWDGSNWVPITSVNTDEYVKTTSSDTAGYLCDKVDNTTIVTDNNKIKVADNLYAPFNHNHDDRYYTQSEINAMLSHYACCNHNHDDRYYTQSCLDGGELDTRYYTEAEVDNLLDGYLPVDANFDTCYYTQDCLNNGILDNRYYTESETDALLANKADCGHTHTWTEVSKVGSSVNDLGDVIISAACSGQLLSYNGSSWVNSDICTSDVSYVRSFSTTSGLATMDGDGNYLTVTMPNHGFIKYEKITISGASQGALNTTYYIQQIINSNTFTLVSPINANVTNESITVTPQNSWYLPEPTTLSDAVDRLVLALAAHIGIPI